VKFAILLRIVTPSSLWLTTVAEGPCIYLKNYSGNARANPISPTVAIDLVDYKTRKICLSTGVITFDSTL
jgi:hypothetical protein